MMSQFELLSGSTPDFVRTTIDRREVLSMKDWGLDHEGHSDDRCKLRHWEGRGRATD